MLMTRINVGIPPRYLPDILLLAEHREIKRIPKNYLKAKDSGSIEKIPESFRLGKGHVLFFIDKPSYTYARYNAIYHECLLRGFQVQNFSSSWTKVYTKKQLESDLEFQPTRSDRRLILRRIQENITSSSASYKYYQVTITKAQVLKLIKRKYSKNNLYL